MPPKVNGSSTIGGKKSTVCTMARSAVSLYTPASSEVSNPISTFSSGQRGMLPKTRSSSLGLSFAAQPAAFTFAVNLLVLVTNCPCHELAPVTKQLRSFGVARALLRRPRDAGRHRPRGAHRRVPYMVVFSMAHPYYNS